MVQAAKLVLEDGSVFEGRAFGAEGECSGEVVFHTGMSGYQEILTDPSYNGQIVTMTYPHIGNTGVNPEDVESAHPWAEGFIARQFSRRVSNQRSTDSLDAYLRKHSIIGIDEVDTRALARRLRVEGSMNGVLSTVDLETPSLLQKARAVPKMVGLDLVKDVTSRKEHHWREFLTTGLTPHLNRLEENGKANGNHPELKYRVALIDYGVKYNILRSLVRSGCDVTVFPASTPAAAILGGGFHGVFLSNGPGDPAAVTYAIDTVKGLLAKQVPIFGICLGHQILALALGAHVFKLPFGHHGANHPVQDCATGRVEITSQNHGFAVEPDSLKAAGAEMTHLNLNDRTVEGLRHRSLPACSVQYHPESSPGPHDSSPLFQRFIRMMESH